MLKEHITEPFVRVSSTPLDSRYFLNPSFLASLSYKDHNSSIHNHHLGSKLHHNGDKLAFNLQNPRQSKCVNLSVVSMLQLTDSSVIQEWINEFKLKLPDQSPLG
jgi:hypothetical protein